MAGILYMYMYIVAASLWLLSGVLSIRSGKLSMRILAFLQASSQQKAFWAAHQDSTMQAIVHMVLVWPCSSRKMVA